MGANINGVDFDSIPRYLQPVVVMAITDSEPDPEAYTGEFEFAINGKRIDIIKFASRVNDWVSDARSSGYRGGVRDGKESAIRALATLIENED
jgi:hypothetical protein